MSIEETCLSSDKSKSEQPSNQSEKFSAHQSAPDNDTPTDHFGFNQFSQYYLNQLNHFNALGQSLFNEKAQAVNPLETNLKIWQESVDFFTQFLSANSLVHPNTGQNQGQHPTSPKDQKTQFASGNQSGHESDNLSDSPLDNPLNNSLNSQIFKTIAGSLNHKTSEQTIQETSQVVNQIFNRFSDLLKTFSGETIKRLDDKSDTSESLFLGVLQESQNFISTVIEKNPLSLVENQTQLCHQQLQLYQNALMNIKGSSTEPLIRPEKGDKRFNDEEWSSHPLFDFLKQSYLLTVNSIMDTIDSADGIDNKTRQRLSFFTRQWLNAVAPSNFVYSNPEILRLTQATGGKNLIQGIKQLAEDTQKSASMLNIRMTDVNAFELGVNIASTPGKVVFRNRMFELIQYTPTTAKVNKRPLVIIPPWINKFYIMDLKEKNSYIRWMLEQGQTIFIISWVNPTSAYKEVGMETYMHEGLLTALDVVENITGEPDANVIGYCIGGMLLALTLSWLTEHDQDKRIASATFFTTMFDFSDPGDLGVFIDERIVTALEQESEKKGVFDGRMMGVAFSLLRENSLYWNYYIQNYLKGERPTPFDLLYWNSDCTNVTAGLHSFVLRDLYLGNKLRGKGELDFDGIKVDLSKVTTPIYVVATLQDHIVKWRGSYESTKIFGGDVTFVLGESGHVAGIINPPSGKYGFYAFDDYSENPDEWFEKAQKHDNSWWLHWNDWVSQYSAGEVDKRQPGVNYKGVTWEVLCDAPGSYVRVRAEEALKSQSI